jgi:Fe-S cluster assembly iron-binding protein IscA
MLTLTDSAVQVIRSVTEQPQLPPDTGIRIAAQDDGSSLGLSVTPGPEIGDETVESEGARVYLEPTAATVLENSTLDATFDEQGDVTFVLAEPEV